MKLNMKEVHSGARIGMCLGILGGLVMAFCMLMSPSCAAVREYDQAKGVLSDETKTIPAWAVDEHYEAMFKALKEGKKIKVIYVKKENPIAAWTLGAGMAIGGVMILAGIAMIALSQGARLWRGLMISAAGVGSFVTFYIMEKYLFWICIGFAVILIGVLLYFYCFARGTIDKAIETNDLQKGKKWDESLGQEAKKLQGGLQDVLSRRWKAVRKRKDKAAEKAKRKIDKIADKVT